MAMEVAACWWRLGQAGAPIRHLLCCAALVKNPLSFPSVPQPASPGLRAFAHTSLRAPKNAQLLPLALFSLHSSGPAPSPPLQSLQPGGTPPRHSPGTRNPASVLSWVVKFNEGKACLCPRPNAPVRVSVLLAMCLAGGLAYRGCISSPRMNRGRGG